MRHTLILSLISAGLLAVAPALAQEHPKEHPEKRSEQAKDFSADELAKAIEAYIQKDARFRGGYFVVFDPVDKKPLALTLDKVHRDKLASIGNGVYFACTDMKSLDGIMYDLDFFMVAGEDQMLQPTEVSIHKKAGKPRYGWMEEGGIWKKVAP